MKPKRYHICWRHRTLDRPDHPYHGSGFGVGRSRRAAIRNFFDARRFVQGDTTYVYATQDAFHRGLIEITECRRVECRRVES